MSQIETLTTNCDPLLWSKLVNIFPQIQKNEIKPFVLQCLKSTEGLPDACADNRTNAERYVAVRALVRHFARLRSAARGPWGSQDVRAFLDSLKLTPECAEELTQILCNENVYSSMPKHLNIRPGLANVQWKLDLSLCQVQIEREQISDDKEKSRAAVSRGVSVILILTLTDGRTQALRLSLTKFHELRFTIATILKQMLVLEGRKCIRRD